MTWQDIYQEYLARARDASPHIMPLAILTSSITIRRTVASAKDKADYSWSFNLQRRWSATTCLHFKILYSSRSLRGAGKIVPHPSHPGHNLSEVHPTCRKLWSIRTRTTRHRKSFFPTAAGQINKTRDLHLLHQPNSDLIYLPTVLLIMIALTARKRETKLVPTWQTRLQTAAPSISAIHCPPALLT